MRDARREVEAVAGLERRIGAVGEDA